MGMDLLSCHPLTLTRPLAEFPVGNIRWSDHQQHVLGDSDGGCHPDAWISPVDWQSMLDRGLSTIVAADGEAIAWCGSAPNPGDAWTATESFIARYPWDLLRANELMVGALEEDRIEGEVHASAVVDGRIWVGAGSRVLPGVVIEGNVVIGEGCKVGPNCYLRGNTSIGHGCHIGQAVEIKNSLVLSRTNVGHLSYVGDSVLGEGVNFGAGTIVSNLRHDGGNHRSMVDGQLVDTGRRKLGAIVGDGVHTGIHTSIYPGRKLWPGVATRPSEVVDRDRMA